MTSRIVIIGAGPAGIRAAQTLIDAGQRPTIIDEGLQSGGQIYRRPPAAIQRDPKALYGFETEKATQVHRAFDENVHDLDYRPQSLVWNICDKYVELLGPQGMETIEWGQLILAAGAMDRIIPVPGWTLPGVFSLGGAQVSLKFQACRIGDRPIFVGTGPLLYLVAFQYLKAGAQVQAVLDTSPLSGKIRAMPAMLSGGRAFAKGLYYLACLRMAGIPVHFGVRPTIVEESSDGHVSGMEWRDARGNVRQAECDAVAMGYGLRSETQMADLCEAEFLYDPGQRQWLPKQDSWGRTSASGVYIAGDGAGISGADAAELTGKRAALAVLSDLNLLNLKEADAEIVGINSQLKRFKMFRDAMDEHAFAFPERLARSAADDVMICRCEGITAGDLRASVEDFGTQDLNRVKAISRIGMGRCQGRICQTAAADILADAIGVHVEEVGRLRGQAPLKPVSLEALAARAPA